MQLRVTKGQSLMFIVDTEHLLTEQYFPFLPKSALQRSVLKTLDCHQNSLKEK